MILCVSMAVALVGAQAETAERTEGEQAALEILTRQMTASATSLIQWGEDVKNLYPELQVQQPSFSDYFPEKYDLRDYCVGVVNPGESFVSFEEGRWMDWRDILDTIAGSGDCVYIAYDNLPIKAYAYLLSEIEEAHDLDQWTATADGSTAICPNCGYVLTEAGR